MKTLKNLLQLISKTIQGSEIKEREPKYEFFSQKNPFLKFYLFSKGLNKGWRLLLLTKGFFDGEFRLRRFGEFCLVLN